MLRYRDGTDELVDYSDHFQTRFHAHQQPFPVQPQSDFALLESMHESNSRHVSVVSVLICWPQTVQSVNGQEVVSYKESISMQPSDAKACNFNFPTFNSAVCVLVLHHLPWPASIWSRHKLYSFFSLMEITYHEAHRNTCTVFHQSSKGNEMFMVMGEDIFIQDRDNSLHFSGWSFAKSAANLGTFVATSVEFHCSVEGAVGEVITLTEDQFEELQTVRQDISDRADVGSNESDQNQEKKIGQCNIRTIHMSCSRRVRVPVRYHDFLWL